VKWLKGLGELMLQLGDLDPEFLFVHDEAIEKLRAREEWGDEDE